MSRTNRGDAVVIYPDSTTRAACEWIDRWRAELKEPFTTPVEERCRRSLDRSLSRFRRLLERPMDGEMVRGFQAAVRRLRFFRPAGSLVEHAAALAELSSLLDVVESNGDGGKRDPSVRIGELD